MRSGARCCECGDFVNLFDCNIVNASATYYYITLIFNATFIHSFGRLITRDLIPNGRNIAVTEQNKGEYVKVRFFFRGERACLQNSPSPNCNVAVDSIAVSNAKT